MRTLLLSLFLVLPFMLSACGGYKAGVIIEKNTSYLVFSGNAKGAFYSVDNGDWIEIVGTGKNELYPLQTGKHKIQVKRDGVIVVDRVVLLSDQNTKEIEVP